MTRKVQRTSPAATVAVVSGASRGAGKGIALALGEAGATVYCLGRTRRDGPHPIDGGVDRRHRRR
jgi:NAD(P)-dependent dehydrogenase (short-subunit alcohol dehydrogenase family)